MAGPVYNFVWLFLCTLFLSLFLALCKRKAETDLLGDRASSHRKILRDYDPGFLDQMVTLLAACTIVSYTMYTVDEGTAAKFGEDHILVWTVPFVVFGLFHGLLFLPVVLSLLGPESMGNQGFARASSIRPQASGDDQ